MKLLHYEHRGEALLSRRQFLLRLAAHALFVFGLGGVSLFAGMAGYHWLEGLSWLDSFLNAAMILGGMGPVNELPNDGAKIFAGCYALYAGVIFIAAIGIMIAPIAHRILHRLHLDEDA